MPKVGIPQALLYYKYYPFWKSLLEGLGFEVLVSPPTNEDILYEGIKRCIDEACFPVKVLCGHVANLKDKVDYLFIPRIASLRKGEFLCSKFFGLPDIIRNLFPDSPILTLNIDLNQSSFLKSLFYFALKFTRNPFKIFRAFKIAQEKQNRFLSLLHTEKLSPPEAIECLEKGVSFSKNRVSEEIRIAVLSHPYNLYDAFINLDLLKKLRDLRVKIFTPEMVPPENLFKESKAFEDIYWTYNKELAAATKYFLKNGIDGIIFVISFPCGPDSLTIDYLIQKLDQKIPILNLVIDEHRADTGFITRLESFIELIKRRKR